MGRSMGTVKGSYSQHELELVPRAVNEHRYLALCRAPV
jgi:hypothetical protein